MGNKIDSRGPITVIHIAAAGLRYMCMSIGKAGRRLQQPVPRFRVCDRPLLGVWLLTIFPGQRGHTTPLA